MFVQIVRLSRHLLLVLLVQLVQLVQLNRRLVFSLGVLGMQEVQLLGSVVLVVGVGVGEVGVWPVVFVVSVCVEFGGGNIFWVGDVGIVRGMVVWLGSVGIGGWRSVWIIGLGNRVVASFDVDKLVHDSRHWLFLLGRLEEEDWVECVDKPTFGI